MIYWLEQVMEPVGYFTISFKFSETVQPKTFEMYKSIPPKKIPSNAVSLENGGISLQKLKNWSIQRSWFTYELNFSGDT